MANEGLYFLKDKKATIYKLHSGGGVFDPKYLEPLPAAPQWCYTRQLSQDMIFQAASYGDKETRLFVFGYIPQVEVLDYIEYKEQWYQVTRVDRKDDYNTETFVYVKDSLNPVA